MTLCPSQTNSTIWFSVRPFAHSVGPMLPRGLTESKRTWPTGRGNASIHQWCQLLESENMLQGGVTSYPPLEILQNSFMLVKQCFQAYTITLCKESYHLAKMKREPHQIIINRKKLHICICVCVYIYTHIYVYIYIMSPDAESLDFSNPGIRGSW